MQSFRAFATFRLLDIHQPGIVDVFQQIRKSISELIYLISSYLLAYSSQQILS